MQESGGFEIRFIGNVNMEYVKKLAEEIVEGVIEGWERVEVDERERRIYIGDDSSINFDEFECIFEEICKTIASNQPKVSFNGEAAYCNLSVDYYVYNVVAYRCKKKELIVKRISGECFDGCCPECGKQLFKPIEYIPNSDYYCDNCDKYFQANIFYDEYRWQLKDGEFILKI